jgi:steroid 5-alpha reductase family enzyme
MLVPAALGWLIAAAAMTALWAWPPRARHVQTAAAIWPAIVGALAVLYAILGDGEWVRRSAIAWMMGSWGARLAVQGIYTHAAQPANHDRRGRPFWFFQVLAAAAVVASLPALLASLNHDPNLSVLELVACGLWVVAFAGETTADRQRLRFTSNPANEGLRCRTGLWRCSRYVDRIFEVLIWVAYATFGLTAVWLRYA